MRMVDRPHDDEAMAPRRTGALDDGTVGPQGAALILEFYPNLTAQQVKYCIEKSAVSPGVKVKKPGSEDELVNLSDISRSGGIINAYEAMKLASTLTVPAPKKDKPEKSTLHNVKD